jgi:predicted TIM-barrel fold metal-dependent hydrolase
VIEDVFVIDPVVHPFNLSEENLASRFGAHVRQGIWTMHSTWNPPEWQMPAEQYLTDWPADMVAETVFLESSVDFGSHHFLRLDSWFKDGLCSRAKNVDTSRRYPTRFRNYLGVDPTLGLSAAMSDFKEQLEEIPNAIGIKLYPHQVSPYRTWRMDDKDLLFPLYEAAAEAGMQTIAVHKAVPNGPVPINPYRIDDVEGAAMEFPDLNFEIVHSGMAFVEETATALARFPNVYASLETTSLLLHRAPRRFSEIMAQFLFWGGPEKIIWSDGCLLCHPEPLLQAFWRWQLPDDLLEEYGLEQITKQDKALILGKNWARVAGLDIEELKAQIAGDEFDTIRREQGLAAPFSTWKRRAGIEQAA